MLFNINFLKKTEESLKKLSVNKPAATILHLRILNALSDALLEYNYHNKNEIEILIPKFIFSEDTIQDLLSDSRVKALELVQDAFNTKHLNFIEVPDETKTIQTDSQQFEHIQSIPIASVKTVINGKSKKEDVVANVRNVYLVKDGYSASEALVDLLNNCHTDGDWQLADCLANYLSLLNTLQFVCGKKTGKELFDKTFNQDLRKLMLGSYNLLEGTKEYCIGNDKIGDKSLLAPLNPMSYFIKLLKSNTEAMPNQMSQETSYGLLSTVIDVLKGE